jgi:MoxR-like ATPase
VLESFQRDRRDDAVSAVTDPQELARLIGALDAVEVARSVHDYIVRIAGATRVHPDLRLGVSTRGTLSMLRVARAYAASEDRDFVTPDDVKTLASSVFTHRMALAPDAELRGTRVEQVLADIVDEVPVPRSRDQ